MEITRVHRWAGAVFATFYLLTLLIRWGRIRTPLSYHIGPAVIGAAGVFLMFEAGYIMVYYFYHGTLNGIHGLPIYVMAGALALFTVGGAGIIQGFKE